MWYEQLLWKNCPVSLPDQDFPSFCAQDAVKGVMPAQLCCAGVLKHLAPAHSSAQRRAVSVSVILWRPAVVPVVLVTSWLAFSLTGSLLHSHSCFSGCPQKQQLQGISSQVWWEWFLPLFVIPPLATNNGVWAPCQGWKADELPSLLTDLFHAHCNSLAAHRLLDLNIIVCFSALQWRVGMLVGSALLLDEQEQKHLDKGQWQAGVVCPCSLSIQTASAIQCFRNRQHFQSSVCNIFPLLRVNTLDQFHDFSVTDPCLCLVSAAHP